MPSSGKKQEERSENHFSHYSAFIEHMTTRILKSKKRTAKRQRERERERERELPATETGNLTQGKHKQRNFKKGNQAVRFLFILT